MRTEFHHFVMTGVQRRGSIWHHSKDGQIVARLVAFAATFILVIDDVFSDITVDILVAVQSNT